MLKKVLIQVILICIMISCYTVKPKDDNVVKNNNENREGNITRDDPAKMKVTVYGADKEVQAVEINDKVYYVIGGKNAENMSEDEIKRSSITAPLKVTEDTVNGFKGIIITYYDVKIFLGRNSGTATTVGIFEPQKNAWTTGNDLDRSLSIQIKLSRNIAGSIDIKRGSISLTYH